MYVHNKNPYPMKAGQKHMQLSKCITMEHFNKVTLFIIFYKMTRIEDKAREHQPLKRMSQLSCNLWSSLSLKKGTKIFRQRLNTHLLGIRENSQQRTRLLDLYRTFQLWEWVKDFNSIHYFLQSEKSFYYHYRKTKLIPIFILWLCLSNDEKHFEEVMFLVGTFSERERVYLGRTTHAQDLISCPIFPSVGPVIWLVLECSFTQTHVPTYSSLPFLSPSA